MCGILGFSSKSNSYNLEKIKTLTLCNSYERGGDATGFYTPKTGIIKNNIPGHNFILSKENFGKLEKDNVLIGHCRKSSVGANLQRNAHPFEFDNIVMCHNGTLKSYTQLAQKYDLKFADYDVDSQVLGLGLDKNIKIGGDSIYPTIFKQYEGAAAVLYYNKNSGNLYAFRDSQRPLYYGFCKEGMYISSLEYSLEIIGCINISQFEEDVVYTIKDGKIISTITKPVTNIKFKLAGFGDFKNTIFNGGTFCPYKYNNEFSGVTADSRCFEYLIGFRIKYTGYSYSPKKGVSLLTIGSFTKDKYYLVSYVKGYQLGVVDNDNQLKEISYVSFDLNNVFPVIGKKCTTHSDIVDSLTKEPLFNAGTVVEVINYKFKDDTFRIKLLDKDKEYSLPISSFKALSAEEYSKLEENTTSKTVDVQNVDYEEIPEENVNVDTEAEIVVGNAEDFVLFDDVESLIDIISDRLETICENYEQKKDVKNDLDQLLNTVIDCYNRSRFEKTIKEN